MEVTRLINPDLRIIESFRNTIIKNVENKFHEKYKEDLYVLVTFMNIELKSGQRDIQRCTDELFKIIEQSYLTNKDFEFDLILKRHKQLGSFVDRLHITNRLGFNNWQHFGAYKVDWVKMEWLNARILEKEKNIARYREAFDENWLLLISNFGTKSSAHRFDFLDFREVNTNFEKVFAYKYMENEIISISNLSHVLEDFIWNPQVMMTA